MGMRRAETRRSIASSTLRSASHRHAGQALLERDERHIVLDRRPSRSGRAHRRRSPERRRRLVPGTVHRADAGAGGQRRAAGLRLAQPPRRPRPVQPRTGAGPWRGRVPGHGRRSRQPLPLRRLDEQVRRRGAQGRGRADSDHRDPGARRRGAPRRGHPLRRADAGPYLVPRDAGFRSAAIRGRHPSRRRRVLQRDRHAPRPLADRNRRRRRQRRPSFPASHAHARLVPVVGRHLRQPGA